MEQGWSGSILSGRKVNGWLEGEGRCVLPNGVVYEGQFKGGNFHGKGKYTKVIQRTNLKWHRWPYLVFKKYIGSKIVLNNERKGISYLGVLIYPDGGRYTAEWEEGLAVSGNYSFKDGLPYQLENWSYLAPSDRRFVEEVQDGFDPQRTVQRRTEKLPKGTYDTGVGYFNGETGEIRSPDGRSLVAVPNALFANWIVTQCKRGAEEPCEKLS